jgi:hydrogenase maturation protease
MGEVMDLVVGIGNTLRADDGVGVRVVESLSPQQDAETLTVHQLTPELAEPLSRANRVLFIDADAANDAVRLAPLRPSEAGAQLGHALSPEQLLGWTTFERGACPRAWLLSVPARSFQFGERLSPETESALPLAREAALAWLAQRALGELDEEDK